MSRGEIVALANFQTALLLGLGNGKAGDLDTVMLQNIGLDFGICGGNLCGDGVQFFGVNLQLDMGVCELDKHTIDSTWLQRGKRSAAWAFLTR